MDHIHIDPVTQRRTILSATEYMLLQRKFLTLAAPYYKMQADIMAVQPVRYLVKPASAVLFDPATGSIEKLLPGAIESFERETDWIPGAKESFDLGTKVIEQIRREVFGGGE